MNENHMLAAVGTLKTLDENQPHDVGPEHAVFDKILGKYCMPQSPRYERLSAMLEEGWTITAMIEHPIVKNAILVSLVRG